MATMTFSKVEPSALSTTEAAAEAVEMVIALRLPSFWKPEPVTPDGSGSTISSMSSSGARTVAWGPTRNSSSGRRRSPLGPLSLTLPPRAMHASTRSPAGVAVPRLPPMVARFRTMGPAQFLAAMASARAFFATTGDSASSA